MRALLHGKIRDAIIHPQFAADVLKPMLMEEIMDQDVRAVVGGRMCVRAGGRRGGGCRCVLVTSRDSKSIQGQCVRLYSIL